MTETPPQSKSVWLTTGEEVPVVAAATAYHALTRLVREHPEDQRSLLTLHAACVWPKPIPEAHPSRPVLEGLGLVGSDGACPDAVRKVVLASVRGLAGSVHLDPPFFRRPDQAAVDVITAWLTLRPHLPTGIKLVGAVAELIPENLNPPAGGWADKFREPDGRPRLPPPSPN